MKTSNFSDIVKRHKQAALDREIREQTILNKIVECGTDMETAKKIKTCVLDKYYVSL